MEKAFVKAIGGLGFVTFIPVVNAGGELIALARTENGSERQFASFEVAEKIVKAYLQTPSTDSTWNVTLCQWVQTYTPPTLPRAIDLKSHFMR